MASVRLTVILIIFGLLSLSTSTVQADLVPVETSYDFGCVGIDFQIQHNYQLVNKGDDTVKIDRASANCDCSTIHFLDSVLAPGDTASILLRFNTANYYGPTRKSISVHTADLPDEDEGMKLSYVSTIGQWDHGVKPEPISLFFLRGQRSKISALLNTSMDYIKVVQVDPHDDIVEIKTRKDKADKGKRIEFEVSPRKNLKPGTYLSNFRVTLEVAGQKRPLLLTIPVKVVTY